jgi:hypothetical protein
MQDRGQCNMHASLYYEYGMMLCINRYRQTINYVIVIVSRTISYKVTNTNTLANR